MCVYETHFNRKHESSFFPGGGKPFWSPDSFQILVSDSDSNSGAQEQPDPLFPFAHGLSYTTFEYQDLAVSPKEVKPCGTGMLNTRGVSSFHD